MGSPECTIRCLKEESDEDIEVNIDIVRDDEDWVGVEERKQRLSKSKKSGGSEDLDGLDGSVKKRSISDRHESRKRGGGSSRGDSVQDEYETRRESRSKQVNKKLEENTLDVLSNWYEDGEAENKVEGVDKPGSGGHSRADESERKQSTSKYTEHGRSHRRRWDEPDNNSKTFEYGDNSDARSVRPDLKMESAIERERGDTLKIESIDIKSRVFEPINDKGIKSSDKDVWQFDSERKNRERSEFLEEDSRGGLKSEDSHKEIFEEHKQRNPSRDTVDNYGRALSADEVADTWVRDRSRRDVENNTSKMQEKIGKRQFKSDNFDMDQERSTTRRKELRKDGSFDDRSKGRDDNWCDRNLDRENKDTWRRKPDKETRDTDPTYEGIRDWDLPRRCRDRIDGRSGSRKDGSRTEAVKTSSKYGISNENYDVIEIQTKPFDYGREDSRSNFARNGDVIHGGEEFAYSKEDRSRNMLGPAQSGEGEKNRFMDGDLAVQDQHLWRDDDDFPAEKSRGQKAIASNCGTGGQSSSGGSLPPLGNQEAGSFSRTASQGARGNRMGRAGRVRPTGRDNQQAGIPVPVLGSTFSPLGLPPPGPMQSLPLNLSPAPGPILPGVFLPPFQPPIVWPGGRGVEMNMLGLLPGLPPVPTGPLGPRFTPNLGNAPNGAVVFSPSGPGRGIPPSMSGPNFNTIAPAVHGQPQDKASGGWLPTRNNAPCGKAPSRGEQNDYSQNFVDTGMRPQNFIRELELTSVVEDYPKLRELIQKKDEIVAKSASPPMYHKCDLLEQVLSPEFFGTKFDVILIDPPWEEYVHRAPGVTDHMEYWTFEEIMNLKIEAIADTPSFIFLWVGDGVGLEQGRQCLKKWGFRRCEDICWVKTNKTNATPGLRHDSHTLFQRSKEHCLMGIKGTVRRSTDGHIIHANIDTDVIIAEEPPYGSTAKPEDMYRIVEHFALGRRRLELFGEDHNIRSGWLTAGKGLSSSNFNAEAYIKNFADKEGKVWVGGGGRNPPPEAPHLVLTTPDIESLRPKSPMKNQQQLQQSASISLSTAISGNKRPTANSPQNQLTPSLNQEGSSSNMPSPVPWASPMEMFKGNLPSDERMFDMYGYSAPFGSASGDYLDYESNRGMNML